MTSERLDTRFTDSSTYKKLAERARDNKMPSRSNPLGALAQVRFPGAQNREQLRAGILEQDANLTQGSFGTVWYKPATVAGIDLKLEPLQPSIGTAIYGLDLATDVENDEVVQFLRTLWLERRVLLFRDQGHISREAMVNFATKFGEVGAPFGEREHMPNSPQSLNPQIDVSGTRNMLLVSADETVPTAASGWHSDATWQPKPPMGSLLMCRKAPPIGGDTCFCDCYAMWEGLDVETKERIKDLTAVHVGNIGHQMDGKTPSAVHPVARTHPETGRTTLYVQQGFVRRFAESHNIDPEEQRQLLWRLKLQEGRPEYTCRVKWHDGSLAMWDNRAVLHTASGDFWPYSRFMERLTILDYDHSRRTPVYEPEALDSQVHNGDAS